MGLTTQGVTKEDHSEQEGEAQSPPSFGLSAEGALNSHGTTFLLKASPRQGQPALASAPRVQSLGACPGFALGSRCSPELDAWSRWYLAPSGGPTLMPRLCFETWVHGFSRVPRWEPRCQHGEPHLFWMWTILKSLLNLLQYCFCFMFWVFVLEVCGVLAL